MASYTYSLLASDSIRLLRLMPNQDKAAPIQCQLCNYPLQKSDQGTHLYEALSYVWGSEVMRQSVSIDEYNLPVTVNLHSALSRLRDRYLERIIWVDSICINQANEREKGFQIELMAKIYSQANRVIVYLGETADDSDQALEDIRVVAEDESTTSSSSGESQERILKLLERPWFRRIWVLQEVAVARRILVVCGSSEINGYAFCSGLNKVELSYDAHTDLQNRIRSLTYLIRGAIFRPKYTTIPSGKISLGELIDMYHTREATKRHDKVYALVGMSSDDPHTAGLTPDYSVPWKTLLQRLIQYVLSKEAFVETWNERQIAVIKGKGCVFGRVAAVENDSARYDRHHVEVDFYETQPLEYMTEFGARWTLQASAKSIRNDDFVCLFQGASKPSIIRLCKDHFAIIMIAVTLQQSVQTKNGYSERQRPLASTKSFPHDLLLVWNWEKSPGNLQDRARYETSVEVDTLVLENPQTASNKVARLCDVGLVLNNLGLYEAALERLPEPMKNCEGDFGKDNQHALEGLRNLALSYKSLDNWKVAEDLFLRVVQTRKLVLGTDHRDTLSIIADLASFYIDRGLPMLQGSRELVTSLPNRIRWNDQITEIDMVHVAKGFDKQLMSVLLDLERKDILVTNKVLKAAATNLHGGPQMMAILLDRCDDEVKITKEVVEAVVKNAQCGLELMTLLLNRRGDEVKILITEEVIKVVASMNRGEEVMALLYQSVGIKVTIGVIEAASTNGQEQVLDLLDQWDSIGSDKERWRNISRLYNAAEDGDSLTVRQLIADGTPLDMRGINGVTPLETASYFGYKGVVELLLATKAVDVNVQSANGETPLFWAVQNGHSHVVRLLLDHGAEPNRTNKEGRSALFIAQLYKKDDVIAMLTSHESAKQDQRAKKTNTLQEPEQGT
ncbi:hypothetical protein G7Y89_g13625 [Cudoniella acicularis]|uniref:Heterokaryon incompatibility domain-containing protein n=1 Tax=Cudoniella acicularis TaxID=354080 RepID=A0A8H4R6W5_9HELO|nr:hypothetical protein G7Y89_g13625 [Cudoniella acicularis]